MQAPGKPAGAAAAPGEAAKKSRFVRPFFEGTESINTRGAPPRGVTRCHARPEPAIPSGSGLAIGPEGASPAREPLAAGPGG
jgi:hypothetical protein